MKRNFLCKLILSSVFLAFAGQAGAQVAPRFGATTGPNNYATDYIGTSFGVTSPAAIAGSKIFKISNDIKDTTGRWGRGVDTNYVNVPVVKGYDSLATAPLLNGTGTYPSLVGKFALLFRGGGIDFSQKAYYAQQKGAIGCIIVNNIPGAPVGMAKASTGGLVTIPCLMVSDVDGIAINNQLLANVPVTVNLMQWGLGYQHDLAILPSGVSIGPAYAIPASQLGTTNGNPSRYKMNTGAFIANFGTSTNETAVKLVHNVNWTPTGGVAASYHRDSVIVASFAKTDSLLVPQTNTTFDLHATGTGRFDFNYSLSMATADQSAGDNNVTKSMYVTDSIFSKSRFDFAAGMPIGNIGYRIGTGTSPSVWGPLLHVAKGGYTIKQIQLSISNGGAAGTSLAGTDPLYVYLFKWTDGVVSADSIIQGGELSVAGFAAKTFTTADTSFRFFTVPVDDGSGHAVSTDNNSTYWIAVDMPGNIYLTCDGEINYFPRSFVRDHNTASPDIEGYAPLYSGSVSSLDYVNITSTEMPGMFPFERYVFLTDSTRYSQQKKGAVPSIALYTSKNLAGTSVGHVPGSIAGDIILYPNPATEVLNANVNLQQTSSKLYYTIVDATGKTVYKTTKTNVKSDLFTYSTAGLSSGQYYLVITADSGSTLKKFTVLNK